MTQEEKAKAYDEALEKAKKELQACGSLECDAAKQVFRLFPILSQSEDEKIRKEILEFVEIVADSKSNKMKWIAWLEKQKLNGQIHDMTYNSANKVGPKFKFWDWIIFNGFIIHIDEVVDGYYRTTTFGGIPNSYSWDIDNVARLWTIQDAKDGDVLYSPCCKLLWIYKDGNSCYIGNNLNYNENCVVVNSPICIPTDAIPATKEQRELLFKKMNEAGYTWNPDEKKLEKIEQKQEWSEEDEEYLRRAITATKEVYPVTANWLKSLKNRVQPQSKEWSKKDEEMTEDLIKGCVSSKKTHHLVHTSKEILDWLKSIKDRVKGKEE